MAKPINNTEVKNHLVGRRKHIESFCKQHFAWPGNLNLNSTALGKDILVAPVNVIFGLPNLCFHLFALLFEALGWRALSVSTSKAKIALPTQVQAQLYQLVEKELLQLSPDHQSPFIQDQLKTYVQTRNSASDITASTIAGFTGLFVFSQFTPGSVSTGTAIAEVLAQHNAASNFIFGSTLGELYYSVFPANPSASEIATSIVLTMIALAFAAAFSGLIHDPIQHRLGIHKRRLNKLIDTLEEGVDDIDHKGFRPKDAFFSRIYDLLDVAKGIFKF